MMSNKYENEMMDLASKLDAVTNSCGEITGLAYKIVDKQDEEALQGLIKTISDITKKEVNPTKEVRQLAKALKDSLISYFGYRYVKKVINDEVEYEEDTRSLDELLSELNELVGQLIVIDGTHDLIGNSHCRPTLLLIELLQPSSHLPRIGGYHGHRAHHIGPYQ